MLLIASSLSVVEVGDLLGKVFAFVSLAEVVRFHKEEAEPHGNDIDDNPGQSDSPKCPRRNSEHRRDFAPLLTRS